MADVQAGLRSSSWTPFLAAIVAGTIALFSLFPTVPVESFMDDDARVEHLLGSTPLIDGHNDLPYLLRLELRNKIYDSERFTFDTRLASHTDLPRLRAGRVGGQFWSVFVECPELGGLDDPNNSVRDTFEQIDVAKPFGRGKIASILGAEGLHQAGSSIALIRQLFDAGVRYITITHNCDNPFATAASTVTETGVDAGLTDFGSAAILEMNRLGMMIDLAHTSHVSMRQIMNITRSPVMFSHSTCYELAKNYRNAPDDVIERLRENGGVLMVMFVKRFLNTTDPEAADVETVVDHIMHVVKVAGWDHIGIGDYPKLIKAVMQRGATDEQVRKLLGENILRVWKRNEEVAHSLSHELPSEEVWDGRTWTRWNNPLPMMIPGNKDRIPGKDYP